MCGDHDLCFSLYRITEYFTNLILLLNDYYFPSHRIISPRFTEVALLRPRCWWSGRRAQLGVRRAASARWRRPRRSPRDVVPLPHPV